MEEVKDGRMEEVKDGRMEEVKDGRMEVALNGWDSHLYNHLSLREGLASETRLELPGLVPERPLGTYCECVCKRIAVWKEGRRMKNGRMEVRMKW